MATILIVLGGVAVATAIAALIGPVVLPLLGFGTGGIAAGSMAASFMSTVYTFGVGMSLLSSMQSAGAVGSVGLGHILASGVVGGAVASVVGLNFF